MPTKESFYPNDWLRIAEKDYARVEYLLVAHDPEAEGFYLQQAMDRRKTLQEIWFDQRRNCLHQKDDSPDGCR
jgi:hypothetical protein